MDQGEVDYGVALKVSVDILMLSFTMKLGLNPL